MPPRKKILRAASFFLLSALAAQTLYFTWVYLALPSQPPAADLVLIYSGPEDRTEFFREWAGPRPLFLFSGQDYNKWKLKKDVDSGKPFLLENQARTTDQNARYCAPIIKRIGAKRVMLALPWYHLPRALLLTRYYLWCQSLHASGTGTTNSSASAGGLGAGGQGITVMPYATTSLPWNWFLKPMFFVELAKFWGSLMRVTLSWVGIQNWPPPSGEYL